MNATSPKWFTRKGLQTPILALAAGVCTAGLFFNAGSASAGTIYWTTATAGIPGSAGGNVFLPGPGNVSVDYNGDVTFAQISGGVNYWIPSTPFISSAVENPPDSDDIIALTGGIPMVNTITFSTPVDNPVMAIVSLGQPGFLVHYRFSAAFNVLSFGPGYWGGPGTLTAELGNVLEGEEGHGTIQFPGRHTSISWTVEEAEYWHGFTVGLPVPEPATGTLLCLGVLACAWRHWRRNQSQ